MKNFKRTVFILLYLCFNLSTADGQDDTQLCIIDNIAGLESDKDPKCYATANRLEDFMYGTPLANATREQKVILQKKLILYIWDKATKKCNAIDKDTITVSDLKPIINELSQFGKLKSGNYYFTLGQNLLTIKSNDLRQYSSVAYSLRAMLSVEQDFLFNPTWDLKPIAYEAINGIKFFVDLATLASLKLADQQARNEDSRQLTPIHFEKSWNKLFEESPQRLFLDRNYPKLSLDIPKNYKYSTLRNIIAQKINSYENYNQISLPILLRNIQVYFARHKWPTETTESDSLKNYLIESLVYLSSDIIKAADQYADQENELFIRNIHVDKAVNSYLPIAINQFEDVIYFPNLEESITIESYDLDAFRDSGLHWRILQYSLSNLDATKISEPDPFAAEILVESIAQWALLVLRVTGDISRKRQSDKISLDDMEEAFVYIQNLIYKSGKGGNEKTNGAVDIKSTSSNTTSNNQVFFDATSHTGIDFYHKSSDWLSRLIRSYVIKKDENLIRMAIPPAFGGSGVAAEDINNDGYTDILLTGGMGNKLYLNNGDGTFTDIIEKSGIDTWNSETKSYSEVRQVIVCDFDNDGLQDVFLSLVNENHKLYKNVNGTLFKDVSHNTKFNGIGMIAGPATAFDYNNDGLLDIYIGYFGNYLNGVLPTLDRNNQNGSPNVLFKNNGNLEFEEVKHIQENEDTGWTQALVHLDINQDGNQDIIVGNDFGINAYYINDGKGSFLNYSNELKTNKPSYTMSIGSADLNKDLYPDLYISNIVVMEKDEKYVNPSRGTSMNFDPKKMENIRTVEANDLFLSKLNEGSLNSYSLSDNVGRGMSSTGWSWDADFFDFDNDGDEDLYCVNGMNDFSVYGTENPFYNADGSNSENIIYAQSNKEKNVFFVNENGYLKEKSKTIGGDLNSNSRSAAFFDLENDGDLDIIVNNYHEKAVLLENTVDNSQNWIKIKLKGDPKKNVNLDAIGSVIIVKNVADDVQIWREVHSTTGYLSVHPKMQHFGVGDSKSVDVLIKWGNGEMSEFQNLGINSVFEIKIGDQPLKIN